jgi:2,4-diketo-3-deoxy-L-fuconate hydrolase
LSASAPATCPRRKPWTICSAIEFATTSRNANTNSNAAAKGKCCLTFGPIGPWLVTKDEVADPQNLSLWLDLNGKRVQNGSTRTMIFPIAKILSYMSQYMILEPGDIVTTGTPPGVGLGMKPPVYLKECDVMELGIAGLGQQRQQVRSTPAAR